MSGNRTPIQPNKDDRLDHILALLQTLVGRVDHIDTRLEKLESTVTILDERSKPTNKLELIHAEIDKVGRTLYTFQQDVHNRFSDIDRQFENIDRKFENIDRQFEGIDRKFENIDKEFKNIDRKIDTLRHEISGEFRETFRRQDYDRNKILALEERVDRIEQRLDNPEIRKN
jgi:chromosome segregation ATPase